VLTYDCWVKKHRQFYCGCQYTNPRCEFTVAYIYKPGLILVKAYLLATKNVPPLAGPAPRQLIPLIEILQDEIPRYTRNFGTKFLWIRERRPIYTVNILRFTLINLYYISIYYIWHVSFPN
jgi:hypothetical protein